MKQKCIKCNKEKDASEFNEATNTESGLTLLCKACIADYDRPQDRSPSLSNFLINKYQRRTLYRCLKEEMEKDK